MGTVLHLFMAITSGVDWGNILAPLAEKISWWFEPVFVIFTSVVYFAIVNVITAVFVDSFLRSSETDRSIEMQNNLCALFTRADSDCDYSIGRDEFELCMHTPQMVDYLTSLDLTVEEAQNRQIFDLIDDDHSDKVDSNELVTSLVRLRGPARSIDLAYHMYIHGQDMRDMKQQCKRIEMAIEKLAI